ncbi:hypothetical protein [Actinocorallia populi]|uniref:hypothetical protein n=1 Tax=Actinocorallia populi TaxID=2079200 RepID=UPI0013006BCD|nr:hypothetical protein [Actinocorallia populi]
MAQQLRITLGVAMRVRDVSRPGPGGPPADGPAESAGPAPAVPVPEAATPAGEAATPKTPPKSSKGERQRLRRLRKRGEQG